jgi:glucose-1-phosphate cytidylyltransferase
MRLREETEHKPKPMVEIGGRPLLWHLMRHYSRHGFHRFVLCLGYKGDVIRRYFLEYEYMNSDFTIALGLGSGPGSERSIELHPSERDRAWSVTLAETGLDTLTGARVKRVERYIETDYFLCTYGDGLSNVDLGALVAFHRAHGKLATITSVSPRSRYGTVITDGDQVRSFAEKPELRETLVNGGFFVFDRRALDYLSSDASCMLEHEPFARLVRDGQMMTYRHDGYWACMDTPRDVQQLNEEWRGGSPGWLAG